MSGVSVPARRRLHSTECRQSMLALSDKENNCAEAKAGPKRPVRVTSHTASPLTPVQNLVSNLKQRLERRLEEKQQKANESESPDELTAARPSLPDNISPGLARLRNTPASRGLKFKRHVLEAKHQETRNKSDKLSVGGGVCMWPEMDNMRLTQSQTLYLVLLNVILVPVTIWIFYKLHGQLAFDLLEYTDKLKDFSSRNIIRVFHDKETFQEDILGWHEAFINLMDEIHNEFDVTLTKASIGYKFCVVMYIAGIGTLLYFLIDNVLAKNKLSPRRIQQWVSLLTVIGLWTLLSLKMLVLAQRLEQSVQDTIHALNGYLAELVYTSHDVSTFERVLLYWRTRCLPPTSRGTLTVMGIVAVQDVMYYLQYYSLPIVTALLTPVIKLVVSLKEIYSTDPA